MSHEDEHVRDAAEALGALAGSREGATGIGDALVDVPAAVLMVDTGTGTVVHANPPAMELCALRLPAPVAEWVEAAGILPTGSVSDNPLTRVAMREPVLGEPVLAPGRARRRVLWVTAFPLPPLAGRPDLALVALLPVDPGFSGVAELHEVRSRALSAAGLSFTISDPHQPDNPLVWVNPAFCAVTGYDESELLGRNCRFLQGPGTDPEAVRRLARGIAQGVPVRETLLNYRRDGSPFWNEVAVSPVYDGAGELTHFVGVQADVTARVDAERGRAEHLSAEQEARGRAEAAGRRLRLLTGATDLLVSTLDSGEALSRLSHLVVPALADWAVVDLVDVTDGRATHRVAATHVDPEKVGLLRAVERLQPSYLADDAPLRRVLRTGEPVFLPAVPAGMHRDVTDHVELIAVYEELGYASAILVPLMARHQVLGALTLVRTSAERAYLPEDLALAEDLARRVALIVDNARLYERQRTIASELQRALMPSLPILPSVDIDAGYLPGADGAQVGGDWFDVLPLPEGGGVIVVGDVSGHDVAAAAAMGQFKSILRAFAWEGHDPATAITKLDEVTEALGVQQVASVLCGRLSPAAEDGSVRLTWARAGHLPPLVLRDTGGVEVLEDALSPIVGLTATGPRTNAEVVLHPGDALVLYTDGLVEERRRDLDVSVAELAEEIAAMGGRSAAEVCASVLEERAHRAASDDLTVLVARVRHPGVITHDVDPARREVVAGRTAARPGAAAVDGPTGIGGGEILTPSVPARRERVGASLDGDVRGVVLLERPLPAGPDGPREARAALRSALERVGWAGDAASALVVTSELVTNAVVNGASQVVLRVRSLGGVHDGLRVEVEDDASGLVPETAPMPGPGSPRGRGLPIVDALASRWGVDARGRGKVVHAVVG
ncbi:MAG TPA: SpoIIE family protein phosphatase [Jiangellales bacterium]|nr:SpoIIE family protein phosphatase [Jiangellales bacterium]